MDRGEDIDDEVLGWMDGLKAVAIEPQVAVTTKSGRVAKRPRPPDEDLELALQQSAANAAREAQRQRVQQFTDWLHRGLAKADAMQECEPQIPCDWRPCDWRPKRSGSTKRPSSSSTGGKCGSGTSVLVAKVPENGVVDFAGAVEGK